MRRAWLAIALLATLLLLAEPAISQPLRLGRPTPATIGYAGATVEVHQRVSASLRELEAARRSAVDMEAIRLDLRLAMRRLTITLLDEGTARGWNGAVITQTGIHLADHLHTLDAAVVALEGRAAELGPAVDSFLDAVSELATVINSLDQAALDLHLSNVLRPLFAILPDITAERLAASWCVNDKQATAQTGQGTHAVPPVAAIGEMLDELELSEVMRANMVALLREVDRGVLMDDAAGMSGRGEDTAMHRAVALIVEHHHARRAARWMPPMDQIAYDERLAALAAALADEAARKESLAKVDGLATSVALITAVNEIVELGIERGRQQPMLRVDTRPVNEVIRAIDANWQQPPRRAVQLFRETLDRMRRYRSTETMLSREYRTLGRQLEQQYLEAERLALRAIVGVGQADATFADPELASRMNQHELYTEDLRRIRRIDEWLQAFARLRPGSERGMAVQLESMMQRLADPGRREDAIIAMQQIEGQYDRFHTLPFEANLKRGETDRHAETLTFNRHAALLDRINAERQEWAVSWSLGEAVSTASANLHRLAQLTELMADLAAYRDLPEMSAQLNRWALWHVSPALCEALLDELPARLRPAVQSAVNRQDAQLARQLYMIEREQAPARLIARLAGRLAPQLTTLADDAASALAPLAPPPPGAWFAEHRLTLAQFTLALREAAYLRDNLATIRQNPDLSSEDAIEQNRRTLEALDNFVSTLALELLDTLRHPAEGLPRPLGFDGARTITR